MKNKAIEPLLSRVADHFGQAKNNVIVISAYIRGKTLDKLLRNVAPEVHKTVYARWQIRDLLTGASDVAAQHVAQNYQADFFAYSPLHAKIYIADDLALVGSANSTARGMGDLAKPNLEILVEHDVKSQEIQFVLGTLLQKAKKPLPLDADRVTEMAGQYNVQLFDNSGEDIWHHWRPRSDPDTLQSFLQGNGPATTDVLADCLALDLEMGDGLQEIKTALKDQQILVAIQGYLTATSLTLHRASLVELLTEKTEHGKEDIQGYVDMLVKWIEKFCGEYTYLVSHLDKDDFSLSQGARVSTTRLK